MSASKSRQCDLRLESGNTLPRVVHGVGLDSVWGRDSVLSLLKPGSWFHRWVTLGSSMHSSCPFLCICCARKVYGPKRHPRENKTVLGCGGMVTGGAGASAGGRSCSDCQGRLKMLSIPLGAVGRGVCVSGK